MGLCLFFLPNFPAATFIQGSMFIPDSRVFKKTSINKSWSPSLIFVKEKKKNQKDSTDFRLWKSEFCDIWASPLIILVGLMMAWYSENDGIH